MADPSVNFWVNSFQMLRFNGNDEQQYKTAEFVREAGDESENGDNSIIRTNSPRSPTPGSYTKKSSPPMSTQTRIRRHSFTPDEKPSKGMSYMPLPNKVVTPADAAAVLAASLTQNYINHDKKHSHKYTADDKSSTKQLKRSISFNHSNRPISPRQTAHIDVAEVLATTVSFVRENNKKLDRLSDEVRSEGQSSDNDMDSAWMSDDSMDSYQRSSHNGDNEEIEIEIQQIQNLAVQLDEMESKYKEQLRGKNMLIDELERKLEATLKKNGKELKKKRNEIRNLEGEAGRLVGEIERLEEELEASKRAITELYEHARGQSPNPEQAECVRVLEQELEEKNKTIEELNQQIQISNQQAVESREKEELISNQLLKYQSLECEWKNKQKTLDTLTSQIEFLKNREVELNEKDALIETLNIRLDTSQKVIAELREKHAPHDLLKQLRQKDYIIDTLTQQVENIDSDIKDKDDDIAALQTSLAEEKKRVEKLKEQTAQIDPLKKKIEEIEDSNYEIRSQLSQKERQLADLERKYKEASRNSQDGQDKLRVQDQTLSALRQDITQLRQTLTVQSADAREKERLLVTLRDETAHMRSNYQGLLNALSEKDQRIETLENLQNASKTVKNDSNDSSEKDSKANKNEVRLNALQKVLNNKIEACRDYEKKIADLEKDFDLLKKQFDETKSASLEKENKIARFVKMNRQLKEEVTELKQKMEEKEQELVLIKSKIPQPNPGKAPAASVRSAPTKTPRSRVSSMYSVSGGESSSDEAAKNGRPRIRKAASLSGIDTGPLKRNPSLSSVSRRISDSPRVSLTRTKSSTSTSSLEERRCSLLSLPKKEVKPRLPSTVNTVDVLKKRRDAIAQKKEPSPINRSAVTQRKRDMEVLNHMLSGVAPDRKNRSSTLAQKRATTGSGAAKKKVTETLSSDSERDVKKSPSVRRSGDLTTIMEKVRNEEGSTSKVTRPKMNRPIVNTKASTSTVKARTSLNRPLPSKKQ